MLDGIATRVDDESGAGGPGEGGGGLQRGPYRYPDVGVGLQGADGRQHGLGGVLHGGGATLAKVEDGGEFPFPHQTI